MTRPLVVLRRLALPCLAIVSVASARTPDAALTAMVETGLSTLVPVALPEPRGTLSEQLLHHLQRPVHDVGQLHEADGDPITVTAVKTPGKGTGHPGRDGHPGRRCASGCSS